MSTEPNIDWAASRSGKLVVVAGIVLVGLNLRAAVTSVIPLIDFIDSDIGFNETAVSIIGMLPPLTLAVFGFIAAPLSRRLGLEATVLVGMMVATVGLISRSMANDIVWFMVFTGVTMMGLGFANVLSPPLIKRYFPKRIELMTTVFTVSLVAGLGIPPMFVVPLTRGFGWRWAIGIWAFGTIVTAMPWVFATYRQFRNRTTELNASAVVEQIPRPQLEPVWKSPTTWGLTILIAINSVASFALMAWLPKLLTDAGTSVDEAALWLGLFTGGQVVVYLVVPALIGRTKHPRTWISIFVICWMLGLAGLTFVPTTATWLWIALTRFGDACYSAGIVLMNLRTRHSRTLVNVSSFAQSSAHIFAASCALVFGQLHNFTGGWLAPMSLLFLIMPIGFVGGLMATRPRFIEDELCSGD